MAAEKTDRKAVDDNKKLALANAMKKIEKDFGKGSIMRLGDARAQMNVSVIPTGMYYRDLRPGIFR